MSDPKIPAAAVEFRNTPGGGLEVLDGGVWVHVPTAAASAIRALPHLAAPATDDPPLTFTYRNHRCETGQRVVRPIRIYHGATEWHPEPQWLLYAYDLAKCETRAFAMADMVFVEHLAAPAGDVADLVSALEIAAGDLAIATGTELFEVRGQHYTEAKAALVASIAAIAAERDEHKRTAERLDVKLFAFTGRAIKAEAERDEARRDLAALLTGERVIVPQSRQHAESLYAVAVTSLLAYGVDREAERDEGEAKVAEWLASNEAVFEKVQAEREVFRERVTKAESERGALAERLRAMREAFALLRSEVDFATLDARFAAPHPGQRP